MMTPLLVLASIKPMRGKRVFGERSKTLKHLWIVPEHERPDPRFIVFRPGIALCGWEQARAREATGEVTTAEDALRVVRSTLSARITTPAGAPVARTSIRGPVAQTSIRGPDVMSGSATRKLRDWLRELGWCIPCVSRLLSPTCKHDDCREHPDLAIACMLDRGARAWELARDDEVPA